MLARVFVVVSSLVLSLQSSEIAWRSTFNETNETSQDDLLTSSWTFHLGFFESGFVPSSSNTSQWSENWSTLDVSGYSEAFRRFVGVWDDDGTVPDGTQGYIWGFNRGSLTPEWILLSANDWTFPLPVANPLDPSGGQVLWDVDGANQVIVGETNQGGIHMRTASVTGSPPFLEAQDWQRLFFSGTALEDADISGFDADPDQDGLSNLAEFAFGLNPTLSDAPCIEESLSGDVFEFTIQRAENVAVDYAGEVSPDLMTWRRDSASVVLVSETPASITYRDLTPLTSGTPRFGRVAVSLQP